MKTRYAVILTFLVCISLIVLNNFLVRIVSSELYWVVLAVVLGYQVESIYYYFKNGG